MELIGYYLLFAFSISITVCLFWFWPLLREAREAGVVNSLTQYPLMSVVVYILLSAVVAPLLVLPMFSNALGEKFAHGLRTEIFKPDQKI